MAAAISGCDSVSLTQVKPAVRCAKRPAPASVVGGQLQCSRREREVEEEAASMSVRASPPSESRGDDGDRDAKTFPRVHICASKG